MKKKLTPINLYCLVSFISIFLLLICFFLSKGELIDNFFLYDTIDSGMDFFHSIEYTKGLLPYQDFNTLYPPLANLMFALLYYIIPREYSILWPHDFQESVWMRTTSLDLRVHQAPFVIFLFFVILSILLFIFVVEYALKEYSVQSAKAIACCMVFSYGMMYALERGNILFLIVTLCMMFVLLYKHENKWIREIAIILLAIAAGLKLYPAFLGVLLIRNKDFKLAIRAIIYGISTVVFPMFVFKEGLGGLKIWLNVVVNFSNKNMDKGTVWGNGFSNIMWRIANGIESCFGIEVDGSWFGVASMMVAFLLLGCAMLLKEEWMSCLSIILAMMLYSPQADYVYVLILIPLLLFLKKENRFSKQNIIPYLAMILMVLPLPIFYERYISYPRYALCHICICVLLFIILKNTICFLLEKCKGKSV